MTNESSSVEQTGMSVLCQGKELVEEQRNRVRREKHSGRLQHTGSTRTSPQCKDHATDMVRRQTHWWLLRVRESAKGIKILFVWLFPVRPSYTLDC